MELSQFRDTQHHAAEQHLRGRILVHWRAQVEWGKRCWALLSQARSRRRAKLIAAWREGVGVQQRWRVVLAGAKLQRKARLLEAWYMWAAGQQVKRQRQLIARRHLASRILRLWQQQAAIICYFRNKLHHYDSVNVRRRVLQHWRVAAKKCIANKVLVAQGLRMHLRRALQGWHRCAHHRVAFRKWLSESRRSIALIPVRFFLQRWRLYVRYCAATQRMIVPMQAKCAMRLCSAALSHLRMYLHLRRLARFEQRLAVTWHHRALKARCWMAWQLFIRKCLTIRAKLAGASPAGADKDGFLQTNCHCICVHIVWPCNLYVGAQVIWDGGYANT